MKKAKRVVKSALSLVLAGAMLAGCGAKSADATTEPVIADVATVNAADESDEAVKELTIAVATGYTITQFLDEEGNLTGKDVELLRAVDELIPDYKINFEVTEMNDILVGLQNGTYDGGICSWLMTAERAKNYKYGHRLGVMQMGLLVKKENEDVKTLDDLAKAQAERGLTMYDAQSGNGMTYVLDVYNEEHPDLPIVFNYTTEATNLKGISIGWVVDGHFDVALVDRATWESLVVADDGAFHDYYDELSWDNQIAANYYTLFNKENVPDDFIEKYSAALEQLEADGTASKLANEFYGYDIYDVQSIDLAK